jgi:4-amino-4-deoxy-L-arabinose transferase-like glycosyltransferase
MDAPTQTAEGERTAAARSAVTRSLLAATGGAALVVLVIITITGGFTFAAGPLHVSAHNWRPPLLIALAAFGAAAASGRVAFIDAASASWTFLDRHAFAAALVLAAATAAVGVAYGTYAASSSDASGYVSESRLIASAQLATDEPLARTVAWPNATWAFSPLGYRPGGAAGELVPTYPAGLPLMMAVARRLAGEVAAFLVVPFLGAVAVLATYGIGTRLHSRIAGLIAAFLLATSPIVLFQVVQPMSDVPVTAWWALALLFAVAPLSNGPIAAGATAGLAILTRPNLLPLALVVALAVTNWPRGREERRRRLDRLLPFAAGIIPAIGAQFLMQWRLYGSPLATGYGSAGDLYALSNIGANITGYARRLVHGESPALVLALVALLILAVTRRVRGDALPLKRATVLALVSFGIVVASYLPYATFAEWSYLRFLLPAYPLVFVLIGALLAGALISLPSVVRATVLLCALAATGSMNVVRAQQEQAFAMHRYESRYLFAGRYLASVLPPNAVVITVQESGSTRYYANVPILRWDQLDVDLDTAIAALRALGRHPVLLVEDWEAPQLAKKYLRSVNARLDWRARAVFGEEIRVFLYDPIDRGAAPRWPADRVH